MSGEEAGAAGGTVRLRCDERRATPCHCGCTMSQVDPGPSAGERERERARGTHNDRLVPRDPLPIAVPTRARQARQRALQDVRRLVEHRRERVVGVRELVARVGRLAREGEEALDVRARGKGAGADPGETRVERVVCGMSEGERYARREEGRERPTHCRSTTRGRTGSRPRGSCARRRGPPGPSRTASTGPGGAARPSRRPGRSSLPSSSGRTRGTARGRTGCAASCRCGACRPDSATWRTSAGRDKRVSA